MCGSTRKLIKKGGNMTKEMAINLINLNEDADVRKTDFPTETLVRFAEENPDKENWGGRDRTLREIDRRIESCNFPPVIEKSVYLALLSKEDIEYLANL